MRTLYVTFHWLDCLVFAEGDGYKEVSLTSVVKDGRELDINAPEHDSLKTILENEARRELAAELVESAMRRVSQ